mmetsp:Transcript_29821/g.41219  ORF Transcript_29821/g.41219 Transcript_29821/m.41219 type:complete len:390 (-) Transcript_29821:82-1251(-)
MYMNCVMSNEGIRSRLHGITYSLRQNQRRYYSRVSRSQIPHPRQVKIFVDSVNFCMCKTTHNNAPKILKADEIVRRLRTKRVEDPGYFAMYSSFLGGIVTDSVFMSLPIDDHMVHRGHGVFDTATLVDGRLYRLEQHLDRLEASAAAARITLPFSRQRLQEIICATCAASGVRNASVRYWLSAGPGNFDINPDACIESCFYVMIYRSPSWKDSQHELQATKEFTVKDVPLKPPLLARMKSTNYLLNCLTAMESRDKGGLFGILIDDNGNVAESCILNVVFVKDNVLLTPKFKHVLAGITVQRILDFAEELVQEGKLIKVSQQDVPEEEAHCAQEMFLVAGDMYVIPIVEWDGKPIGNRRIGPITRLLHAKLTEDVHSRTSYHVDVRYET